eukprot:GFKZ01015437.1.p1 GENE.GFKZ01015437.1~~GFKZ01015437.1.p1  ORF type:complete len:434 (-),score=53.45 GFKZ01015437.1:37-1338(-)
MSFKHYGSSQAKRRIHDFFTPSFSTAPPQTDLDLSNCSLTMLPPILESYIRAHPRRASSLRLINLANNHLSSLPEFLSLLPNLRILFLLANNFTCLPPILSRLTSLTMLSFKSNRLSGTLHGTLLPPNISWLILTSNQITALADDVPYACRHVRKLMLSNNNLCSLPPTFAHQMTSLELLRLANNQFDTFPMQLLSIPSLTWLSLAGNPCTNPPISHPSQLPSKYLINDIHREYDVDWKHPFGGGTSGTAFPGIQRHDGQKVAVKQFKAMKGSDGKALDEIAVSLAAAGVPGIVQAVGFWAQESEDGQVVELGLVTELVGGGAKCIAGPPSFESCTRSVYDEGKSLDAKSATRIVEVVGKAVQGLLDTGIAHGDVYGHNVMVGGHGEEVTVVLGDLGAAWWVPPEVREGVRKIEERAVMVFRGEIEGLVERTK